MQSVNPKRPILLILLRWFIWGVEMNREELDKKLISVNKNPRLYYAVNDLPQDENFYNDDLFLIKQTRDHVVIYYLERGQYHEIAKTISLEQAYDFLWTNYLDVTEKSIVSSLCAKAGLYEMGYAYDEKLRTYIQKEIFAPTRSITEANFNQESFLKRLEAVKKLIEEKLPIQ